MAGRVGETREGSSDTMLWTFARHAVDFLKVEDGPTAVEYAVMLALIIVVCIGTITALGSNANDTFSNVALNGTLATSS